MKTSRRAFVSRAVTGLADVTLSLTLKTPLFDLLPAYALAQDSPERNLAEGWMDAWMKPGVRGAEGPLHLGRFVEPMWFLLDSIKWTPNPNQEVYQAVTVPVGFVTDLASIPRAFWSLLPPDGEYTYSAILHDYLYWTQTRSRETADMIFKFSMQDFGVSKSTTEVIYAAVRAGGGASWENNAKLRRVGEKRVLARFPNDPTTRWDVWKGKPGVFTEI